MDWRYKLLVQLALSWIPKGESWNYLLQRHVTRTIPISEAGFNAAVFSARRHIDALRRYLRRSISEATFYEFGAGWDLTIPLAYYGLGAQHQILVDIRRLARLDLANDSIRKYQTMPCDFGIARRPAKYLNERQLDLSVQLQKHYGIDYRAPCDARRTGLPSSSIDCITSTDTLEHIPPADIVKILQECHRILCDDGVISFVIDYDDHYSYFDPKISKYNFLQYSDRLWAMFNPPLHHQNRLRHRDYLKLLQNEGFDVVEDQRKDASDLEMNILSQLSLAKRFKSYSVPELAVHSALIVARKRTARAG
jgi:hypothetical protein